MPISRVNADRCLQLLWECRSRVEAPEQAKAYEEAISTLHVYLTDLLPATLPCVRAQAEHGVVEIFPNLEARVQDIHLKVNEGEKLGIVLDCTDVNGGLSNAGSPIVITLIRPHSVAARDGRLARGDQVLYINSHSLSQVSLQRARWLLDSAERSHKVRLSTIASGLMAALKHPISRQDILSLTPQGSNRSRHNSKRVKRLLAHKVKPAEISLKDKQQPPPKETMKPVSRTSLRAGYTPSIGSRHDSDYSLVSSTVETAAQIARSSMRSSKAGAKVEIPFKKRQVRKMHIMKGASGLGLRIIGGKGSKYGDVGIFVSQLEEGGAAFNDGRLHPRDELLMVDGKSLVGLTHDEAVGILKATQKLVQLVVATVHMEEGESLNSSLHSIPEMFASKIKISDAQSPIDPEPIATGPELIATTQNNALEMKTMTGDDLSHTLQLMETNLDEVDDGDLDEVEDGDVNIVEVIRVEGQPLGVRIKQGYSERSGKEGIFVCGIDPNGVVGKTKQLHKGDQLLRVNRLSLEGKSQQEAVSLLMGVKGEVVKLHVASGHVPVSEKKEVLLHKTSGQPLGIKLSAAQISTENSSMGVTIAKIAVGSPAHNSGKLSTGDQLLSINDMSVLGMRVEQVKGLLSSIPGEEIKLVVASKTPDTSSLIATAERTSEQDVEGTIWDDVGTDLDKEKATHLHPVVTELPSKAMSSSEENITSEEDSFTNVTGGRVVQSRQSQSESSILGDLSQLLVLPMPPSPLHSPALSSSLLSVYTPPLPPDSPSALHLPPPPPSPPPDLPPSLPPSPSSSSAQPPIGFVSMQFKLKKRPRAGIGITLAASEGLTAGLFLVRRIATSGAAAKDGRIQIGDRLVSVNGMSLSSLPHAAVLKALSEANKEVELVVWRDPNHTLASSSSYSLGSYASGSRTSLLSDEASGEGSPSPIGAKRYQHSQVRNVDSPLATRFSYAGVPTSYSREAEQEKRWSEGDVLMKALYHTQDSEFLPSLLPDADKAVPPAGRASPDASGTTTPIPHDHPGGIPEPPTSLPPEILIEGLPELPTSNLPETFVPLTEPLSAPPSSAPEPPLSELPPSSAPELPPSSAPELPPLSAPELPPLSAPELPPSSAPELPPSSAPELPAPELSPTISSATLGDPGDSVNIRPSSLQVPRGARQEKSPFEIELRKGLFGLGVTLGTNQMGMLAITSLSSRSIVAQDGNIKVGDILLSINDESMIGMSEEKAEKCLKALPRGPFRLTVMPPPKDVTGEGMISPEAASAHAQELSMSATPRESSEDSVINEILQHSAGSSLGFEIEGGSNTPLQYVFIKSLEANSPASNCQRFMKGDQLVMVGDTCFIGITNEEAKMILEAAPPTVEVVAQRKLSSEQPLESSLSKPPDQHLALSSQPLQSASEYDEDSDKAVKSGSDPVNSNALENPEASLIQGKNLDISIDAAISEDLVGTRDLPKIQNTEHLQPRKGNRFPENTMKIELMRNAGEKLGIKLVGGKDNPNLEDVHVKQVVPGGAAARDGQLKTGDHIISVNDQNLSGLSNKEALRTLKEAGEHVTLIVTRKIGRMTSRATTPLPSTAPSKQGSGETSRVESRMSPQHSPRATRHGHTGSSDEGSREGSRSSSPQHTRRHTRRKSVSVQGEVLKFRDDRSTLPRKIMGDKGRVHLVELHKGPTGLGLQLQGSTDASTPITVKAVLRGGPAYKSGKIHVRDEIIEVNSISFQNLSQQDALKAMKGLPQGKVSIILRDEPSKISEDD